MSVTQLFLQIPLCYWLNQVIRHRNLSTPLPNDINGMMRVRTRYCDYRNNDWRMYKLIACNQELVLSIWCPFCTLISSGLTFMWNILVVNLVSRSIPSGSEFNRTTSSILKHSFEQEHFYLYFRPKMVFFVHMHTDINLFYHWRKNCVKKNAYLMWRAKIPPVLRFPNNDTKTTYLTAPDTPVLAWRLNFPYLTIPFFSPNIFDFPLRWKDEWRQERGMHREL